MKKLFILLLLFSAVSSSNHLFGQKVNMPVDSVRTLLCRKWVFDYTIVDNQKMGAMPGAPVMNYEFVKDGTLLVTVPNAPENYMKGTWAFDAGKKLIRLTINGRNMTNITSLKGGELIMSTDMKEATPSDPAPIIMVYQDAKP